MDKLVYLDAAYGRIGSERLQAKFPPVPPPPSVFEEAGPPEQVRLAMANGGSSDSKSTCLQTLCLLVAARRTHKHGGRHGRGPRWRDEVESRGASRDLEARSECYYASFSDAQDVTLGIRPGHRCVGPKDVKATAHATALHFRNGAQRPVRVTGPAVPGARK